ncbi:MAG TPA: heme ABC exporter ATP-binding protein CcmA [Ktedonobacterales bacterium]|nr:heme ABC exporter ATP-binding protein CcmA [Ktedonobacterales bacterium]
MNAETPSALAVPTEMDGRMPVEQSKAVVVTRVRKAYGLRPVLRDVSFEVAAGQCAAVLGPNGAGKTTLLRILATLTRPAQGNVSIAGYDALHEAHTVRRLVGYVGHAPLLYDELTARENLLFFARMYGLPEAESRVDALLARVGMRSRANDRAGTFSRGLAQRVALARGILHSPQVLLLDEPDTGLDEDAIALLHELISERQVNGLTTLLTTHTLERGLLWSDMVVVLTNGRVAHTGASADVTLPELRALYAGAGRSGR